MRADDMHADDMSTNNESTDSPLTDDVSTSDAVFGVEIDDEPIVGSVPSTVELTARRAIEATLMVADEPVTPQLLGELLEMAPSSVEELCATMAAEFLDERRGFVLVRVAGGYRFQSHPDMVGYVERFVLDGQAARLSAAALETLAIVAYKQPISRGQVAQIRGVNVDATMRTLVQRGYVAEVAIDPGPGQASLFGTTASFLQHLGMDDLAELPPLGDLVPDATVMEVLEASLQIDGETGRPRRGPHGDIVAGDAGVGDARVDRGADPT